MNRTNPNLCGVTAYVPRLLPVGLVHKLWALKRTVPAMGADAACSATHPILTNNHAARYY